MCDRFLHHSIQRAAQGNDGVARLRKRSNVGRHDAARVQFDPECFFAAFRMTLQRAVGESESRRSIEHFGHSTRNTNGTEPQDHDAAHLGAYGRCADAKPRSSVHVPFEDALSGGLEGRSTSADHP